MSNPLPDLQVGDVIAQYIDDIIALVQNAALKQELETLKNTQAIVEGGM